MPRVLTFLLAGGAGERLRPLSAHRAKPAVAFGTASRLIDFSLRRAVEVGPVRVLTQFAPDALEAHVHAGYRRHGVACLRGAAAPYRGTADAVRRHLALIDEHRADVVLVLSGDHVYRADLAALVARHRARGAAATLLVDDAPAAAAERFGIVVVDAAGVPRRFVEKPRDPAPFARLGRVTINLGVYCFDAGFLRAALAADDGADFGRDVLPRAVACGELAVDRLAAVAAGPRYWRDVGTIDAYFDAHMDLLGPVPAFRADDGGVRAGSSLLGPGCDVAGAALTDCVVAAGARVAPGCELERCVVLPGAVVGPGVRLRGAIVDEGCELDAATAPAATSPAGVTVFAAAAEPARHAVGSAP